ncbi:MAG: fatty acid desaturase [Bacteroidia bacterium]|nr:fatty acid desaturase [Bacteroidia bacterium]
MDRLNQRLNGHLGLLMAALVLASWAGLLGFSLPDKWTLVSPWPWLLLLLQTHLYTGIFITAHDAMHGAISRYKLVNEGVGWIAALLFAFNWYPRLLHEHKLHHAFPTTEKDPDFHRGGFWRWYLNFAKHYVSLWQILAMALTFNLLILVFPEQNVILFWMIPSLLSTLQLFYFGTYLPHRGFHEPGNPHKSRSQARNHLWAFLSCYFFGYHFEHHDHPKTPWWLLYQRKNEV